MKLGDDTRVPESACLECPLDCAREVSENGGAQQSGSGDFTICITCGHLMVWDDNMEPRQLTDAEIKQVAGDKRIRAVQHARGKMKEREMKFAVIKPAEQLVQPVTAEEPHDAFIHAGLNRLRTDHSVALRPSPNVDLGYPDSPSSGKRAGVGIFVAQDSMFVDPMQQSYFAIGRTLFAGNAVAYGVDNVGKTVDIPIDDVRPEWFRSANLVELAIREGRIDRPRRTSPTGQLVWQWPDRRPPLGEGEP